MTLIQATFLSVSNQTRILSTSYASWMETVSRTQTWATCEHGFTLASKESRMVTLALLTLKEWPNRANYTRWGYVLFTEFHLARWVGSDAKAVVLGGTKITASASLLHTNLLILTQNPIRLSLHGPTPFHSKNRLNKRLSLWKSLESIRTFIFTEKFSFTRESDDRWS